MGSFKGGFEPIFLGARGRIGKDLRHHGGSDACFCGVGGRGTETTKGGRLYTRGRASSKNSSHFKIISLLPLERNPFGASRRKGNVPASRLYGALTRRNGNSATSTRFDPKRHHIYSC